MTFHVYKRRLARRNQRWRWRLIDNSNGLIIGDSGEGYGSRLHCLDMVAKIQTLAAGSETVEDSPVA